MIEKYDLVRIASNYLSIFLGFLGVTNDISQQSVNLGRLAELMAKHVPLALRPPYFMLEYGGIFDLISSCPLVINHHSKDCF